MTGGGAGLNFKVRAYAELPESGAENEIAVITDAEITGWFFSVTEPITPEEGMVWFYTGSSSSVAFNALKTNGIEVYPTVAKQYIGNAWVRKNAMTYQNGEWITWSITLYDYGTIYPDITGDWVARKVKDSAAVTLTFEASDIKMPNYSSNGGGNPAIVYPQKKVDLTGYTTAHAIIRHTPFNRNAETLYHNWFGAWVDADSAGNANDAAAGVTWSEAITEETEVSFDVIELSGEYNLGIKINSNTNTPTLYIYKMWVD